MAKKKRKSSRSAIGGFAGARTKPLIAGVAVGLAEPFINQIAAKVGFGLGDDIVKIGAGYFLSGVKGFGGWPSLIGQGLMVTGARNLAANKINLSGLLGGGTVSTNGSDPNMIG